MYFWVLLPDDRYISLSKETCNAAEDCPATKTESEATPSRNTAGTKASITQLCNPEINIRPNGTYYDDTDIYRHYNTLYTPKQQRAGGWYLGNLSFMVTNTSAPVVPSTPILVSNLVVAESYMKPLEEEMDNCSIQIGIVELVKRNEQLLLYEHPPNNSVGVLVKEGNLYPPANPYHYVISTGEYSLNMTTPFVNMPRNYSHATFETPCNYTSYLITLSQVQEKINFTCNYTADGTAYHDLNHTELLIEKYILLVPIDRDRYSKSIPIGVHFTYFASMDVMCSDASSDTEPTDATTHELPPNGNLYGKYKIRFLNESEIRTANFQGILQEMGEVGWATFQRVPLEISPHNHLLNETCTVNPFESTGLPQCEQTRVLLHKGFRHTDEL